ncbi:hypothetical protein HPB50_002068 [Hyalomma asiaticum]|uniref:Uncharacterized protein n=1 Tax=Hyalomma asiaticum TaxID=266040 RepID=A0ACB7T5M7_HYAAI|nr:hypothetical protein HPB50_002068 [Hyalomma asiaticum]
MQINPDSYAKYSHYPSHLNDEVLRKTRFLSPLNEDKQALEVGCGPGHFTRQFLLPHCQPCKRIVATDILPGMIEFAKEHFSHEAIIYDVLDIATPDLTSFLDRYGKFDRVVSFLTFHTVKDHKAAYANIANLLKDQGECLVTGMSSIDYADVWEDVCSMPKWKGRIPDAREVLNSSIDFNRMKSTSQVEAEVRETLRGTGLQCISCEVQESSWKHDDIANAVEHGTPEKAFSHHLHHILVSSLSDAREVLNSSIDFNRMKSTSQVEAEVRETLRGTGLQCISCEVQESSWKHDDIANAVDMLITTVPFKASIPAEEWTDFRSLVTEVLQRKLSTPPGDPLAVKIRYYVVHALKSAP